MHASLLDVVQYIAVWYLADEQNIPTLFGELSADSGIVLIDAAPDEDERNRGFVKKSLQQEQLSFDI
jgi:hypothetical protein